MNGYNNPAHRPAPHPTKGKDLVFSHPVKSKDKRSYDRVSVTLPKGTKERIKATGESINGFIIRSVIAELERLEGKAEQTGTAEQEEDKPPFME